MCMYCNPRERDTVIALLVRALWRPHHHGRGLAACGGNRAAGRTWMQQGGRNI